MTRVGLTGGIGSGKTTVARVFRSLGIPVFEADAEGRRILSEEPEVIDAVARRFGRDILRDGVVERRALASVVFKEQAALSDLNAIIHPAVRKGFSRWSDEQEAPYVLMESAIMVDSGSSKLMDRIVLVTAPEELRIERVMARDGVDAAQVKVRMDNQLGEEQRLAVAQYVIHNDDTQLVIPQVLSVHEALLNFAKA